MRTRRIKRCGAVFFALAAATAVWWIIAAGPITVYRTVVYNFSGIDDYRIFPQRRLTAPQQPFRFREVGNDGNAPFAVSFGSRHEVPLSELLSATETVAFLIVKNDAIVFEKYLQGFDRASPSLSFSMAKSLLSVLIGCAIADGYLKSVDQPVTDFVPELKEQGFASVTLKHLLQMTSGIDYMENDFPLGLHVRFYYTNRLEPEILNLRLREPPGTRFVYKSGDAFVLTLALKRALGGMSITQYMQERIWNPLGMEADGVWSIDHAPDGLEKTSCCIAATARDFAKFGRLYLNKGSWNGRRIVPEVWVRESTRSDTSPGSNWNYQHLWWLVARDRPDFMANGHLGQFLYINPSAGVVIVRLGKSMGGLSREEWTQVFMSLSDGIR
ncbi:MAG: serine hydrolase [Nitrospirae bacterium]|nr:serine hydrolase [Nitrospirota bacterium]